MIPVIVNGVTNPTDAMALARLGVSGLGFHLDESNPRYVEYSLVKSLVRKLPNTVQVFIEPDQFGLNFLTEISIKLKTSSVVLPTSEYKPEYESLGCTVTLKDSADTLLNFYYPHPGFTVIPNDLSYTSLLEKTGSELENWRQLGQQHYLMITSDVGPEELPDAVDFFRPAGLFLEGITESHTGLQDYSLVQEYVATLGKLVTYV